MNKRITALILIFVLLSVFTLPIHADTGPKPSVKISFTNVTDTEFYVTLLSKHDISCAIGSAPPGLVFCVRTHLSTHFWSRLQW